jgi:hypothetical protein
MSTNYLFTEKQKFTHWWIWIILLGFNCFFLYGIYRQIIMKEIFGDNPMSNAELLLVYAFLLVITLFFIIMRLETKIDKEGIYVRLFPLHVNYKFFKWNDIEKAYIRKYNPILEFGGWGIRFGFKGMAYNVSGNKGLQLEFRNGYKLLIGTNRAEDLNYILTQNNFLKN